MAVNAEVTKYICLFHHRDHAAAALKDLEAAGVPRQDTTVIANADSTYGAGYEYNAAEDLKNFGVPERDLKHLQDEVRDGGVVLIVEGVMDLAKTVENIFGKHSAGKIDETDVPAADGYTDEYDDTAIAAAPLAAAPQATAPVAADTLATDRNAATSTGAVATDANVIPVIEEGLLVGKREVETGAVRVYSRMVDVPVSESVTLHEERVVIERTPVNRPLTEADLHSGHIIEAVGTTEEAVIGKVARVVEEVRIGTVGSDRTETINDSVRHTEIEVEPVETVATTPRQTY